MGIRDLHDFIEKESKRMNEDPIGFFTDKNGKIKVYLDPYTYSNLYKQGYSCTGSTESFLPSDIIQMIPAERIKSITHCGVIVEIKGE